MKPRVSDIMHVLEEIAPAALAEGWDRVGLQVGEPGAEVDEVLVVLDVTGDMAAPRRLVVSHHPVILRPLEDLRVDRPKARFLRALLTAGTSVVCAHTNLDVAKGGTADTLYEVLREQLGLKDPEAFGGKTDYLKLVVFVPEGCEDRVMDAVCGAGAGFIGRYSRCTFQAPGTGTFMPLGGSRPFIGREGDLERVREVRLETIVDAPLVGDVLRAMRDAHPYEEVAYDLYPLFQEGPGRLGRIAPLANPLSLEEVALRTSATLKTPVRFVGEAEVTVVALVPGSGSDLLEEAVSKGAQCMITGDIKYHVAREAQLMGFGLVDAGHFATEAPVLARVARRISEGLSSRGFAVPVRVEAGSEPFQFRGCTW